MIKVIVAITTYNLEKYIAQALDSVLMQKTNFDYKIRVADDCSTDSTTEILESYRNRYPEKVEVLFSEKNLGSLPNSNRLLDKIDCEYFTFLDGDDYWLTDDRLQKQVDFLDQNKKYSMCGGNTQILRDNKMEETMLPESMLGRTLSFDDYIKGRMPAVIHTSSILFRNCIFSKGLPECYLKAVGTFEECALRGEDFRRILHLEQGPIFVESAIISVYRIHEKGMWQGATQIRRIIETAISYNFYRKYFGDKYGGFFSRSFINSYNILIRYISLNSTNCNVDILSSRDTDLLGRLLFDVIQNNPKWFERASNVFIRIINKLKRLFGK